MIVKDRRSFIPMNLIITTAAELHTLRCALSTYHAEVCDGRTMGQSLVSQQEQRNHLEQAMMALDEFQQQFNQRS